MKCIQTLVRRQFVLAAALLAFAGLCQAQEDIRIGMLLPQSGGPFIPVGADLSDGFQMAIDELGGAVAGRKLTVLREDTMHKPDVSQAKARKLVFSDKADFLVGPISANELTALVDFSSQTKTPLIIPNAGTNGATGKNCTPWALRTGFSNDQVMRNLGPWMLKNNYKRISVLSLDYLSGREIVEGVVGPFTQGGGTVVSQQFAPFGPITDFGVYLTKIKQEKPDAVFAFIPGTPGVAFIKQYAEFGLKGAIPLMVGGWVISPQNLPAAGDAAEGVVGILNYVPSIDNAENRAFVQRFERKHQRPVSEYAAYGYDTGRLIHAALVSLGGKTADKAAFVKALHTAKVNGTRGPLTIDPLTNNVIQDIYVFKTEKVAGKMDFKLLDRFPSVRDPQNGCKL